MALRKYCSACGSEIDAATKYCPNCGMGQGENEGANPMTQGSVLASVNDDNPNFWIKVVCFFFPLVGLILFLAYKSLQPVSAKAYGKMALIGVAVSIGVTILLWIIGAVLLTAMFTANVPLS